VNSFLKTSKADLQILYGTFFFQPQASIFTLLFLTAIKQDSIFLLCGNAMQKPEEKFAKLCAHCKHFCPTEKPSMVTSSDVVL
jgi:hypothetical protein